MNADASWAFFSLFFLWKADLLSYSQHPHLHIRANIFHSIKKNANENALFFGQDKRNLNEMHRNMPHTFILMSYKSGIQFAFN